ncbi:hypothetical protein ABZY31_10075 [Streptomyces sp. NPDC006529]|uniref:hypothetical protein n=1 Tax=Streptomyces sp. NPDC006529 TaxID=3157177 RepID=UPI0033A539F7
MPDLPAGVEVITRHAPDGRHWRILLHHTPGTVPLPSPAHDLLTGALAHEVAPGGCAGTDPTRPSRAR